MNIAVLTYRVEEMDYAADLLWIDLLAKRIIKKLPVPISPNLGVFEDQDRFLVSYSEPAPDPKDHREWLDIYRLSDWSLLAHLSMDCRAHFNMCPQWSTFLPGKDPQQIYVYKALSLGDHLAVDYICGLDLDSLTFSSWSYQIPDCVAGWSASGGNAQAQLLFVADGLKEGTLEFLSLEQKIGFWLGPEEGMGPMLSLGERPKVHNELGHARAILSAPKHSLSAVVLNDGWVKLFDTRNFIALGQNKIKFKKNFGMANFAAEIDPDGRFLYVGISRPGIRQRGQIERIVVHNLATGKTQFEIIPDDPFSNMTLSKDGRHLCAVSIKSGKLWLMDSLTGKIKSEMKVDGFPQYVMCA